MVCFPACCGAVSQSSLDLYALLALLEYRRLYSKSSLCIRTQVARRTKEKRLAHSKGKHPLLPFPTGQDQEGRLSPWQACEGRQERVREEEQLCVWPVTQKGGGFLPCQVSSQNGEEEVVCTRELAECVCIDT